MRAPTVILCSLLLVVSADTDGRAEMENDVAHNSPKTNSNPILIRGRTIPQMFSLCQPGKWHEFQKKHRKQMQMQMHMNDVHRVKCDLYEKMKPCLEGDTSAENTWSCMRTHCGDHLTEFVERAGHEQYKRTCQDVSTYEGKVSCVFDRLGRARSCSDMRHICETSSSAALCERAEAQGDNHDHHGHHDHHHDGDNAHEAMAHSRRLQRSIPNRENSPNQKAFVEGNRKLRNRWRNGGNP